MAPKPGYLRRILERFEEIVGVGGVKVDGQVEAVLTGRTSHAEVVDTATTSNQTEAFDVEWISHISNDGSVNLHVAFDADSTVAGNRLTIHPGEVLENFPRRCAVLNYSCASGTCAFRAVGVK